MGVLLGRYSLLKKIGLFDGHLKTGEKSEET